MTTVLFATAYTALLIGITALLAEYLIYRLQSKPIRVEVNGALLDTLAQISASLLSVERVTVPLRIIHGRD